MKNAIENLIFKLYALGLFVMLEGIIITCTEDIANIAVLTMFAFAGSIVTSTLLFLND